MVWWLNRYCLTKCEISVILFSQYQIFQKKVLHSLAYLLPYVAWVWVRRCRFMIQENRGFQDNNKNVHTACGKYVSLCVYREVMI